MFQNKSMSVVGECQSKFLPLSRLQNEIFLSEDNTNKETSTMVEDMEVTAFNALLANIQDEKIATVDHLSSAGGSFCWDNTSGADHTDGVFKITVNDTVGRYFGAMTGQLQYYGKIGLTNTGGVIQVRVNGDLLRGFDTGCKIKNAKTVERILHELSE